MEEGDKVGDSKLGKKIELGDQMCSDYPSVTAELVVELGPLDLIVFKGGTSALESRAHREF